MIRKTIVLVCFFSGIAAVPVSAQLMRSAESQNVIRDKDGNIIGTEYFSIQVTENSYEAQVEAQVEALRQEKMAYFIRNIGMTSKESERFWPIYNEYSYKRDSLSERAKKILLQLNSSPVMSSITDNEVKALLDSYMICIEKDGRIQMEYYKKFLKILPAKKVYKVYQSEYGFKEYLLRKGFKDRRQ